MSLEEVLRRAKQMGKALNVERFETLMTEFIGKVRMLLIPMVMPSPPSASNSFYQDLPWAARIVWRNRRDNEHPTRQPYPGLWLTGR